jgi:hypothetical protein
VIVAVIGLALVFVAVNDGMEPVPFAAKPIAGLLLTQEYTVPGTLPVKFTAVVLLPEQRVWSATAFTVGIGFTLIVNDLGVPLVTPSVGVTMIVATTGEVPVLIAVNAAILPVPLAASPIDVLLLTQLKIVPGIELTNTTVLVLVPLQTV